MPMLMPLMPMLRHYYGWLLPAAAEPPLADAAIDFPIFAAITPLSHYARLAAARQTLAAFRHTRLAAS
jgi:hypothetical protein